MLKIQEKRISKKEKNNINQKEKIKPKVNKIEDTSRRSAQSYTDYKDKT